MAKKFFRTACLGAALLFSACSTGPAEYEMYRVTQDDVLILEGAKDLLSSQDKWTRNEETQCNLTAEAWTLFCALQKSSYNILGEFQLRRPALEEVRVITEQYAGQTFERRLIDFNNRPETSFEDVQKVLDLALQRIRAILAAS